MEFLDKLILPQSAEHIQLLHYLLTLIQFLFIPFISIIIGGTTLSLYYKRKGLNEDNNNYLRFAKDIIELVTINKSIGVIIGIAPLLTSVLIFAQLLHTSQIATVGYMMFSLLLLSIGLILIYAYRYSLTFSEIFSSIDDNKISDSIVSSDIKKFRQGNQHLNNKSGKYGIALLYISLWVFIGAFVLTTFNTEHSTISILSLFSIKVLTKYISFILAAFAITGGTIFFGFFYWEGGKKNLDEEYKQVVKSIATKVTFTAALLFPIFLLIDIYVLPAKAISGAVIGYGVVALLLIFLAYHFLYVMTKESSLRFSGPLFYIILFALLCTVVKDQLAMSNATKVQAEVLNASFDKYLAALEKSTGTVKQVSGQDIFNNICSACHRFDRKLVGPAYKNVLPKYEGHKSQLVAFIRNPVKKSPDFPPMPNPGLKPNEAEAVATYILGEYKKY